MTEPNTPSAETVPDDATVIPVAGGSGSSGTGG